jgi:hypothetical protein
MRDLLVCFLRHIKLTLERDCSFKSDDSNKYRHTQARPGWLQLLVKTIANVYQLNWLSALRFVGIPPPTLSCPYADKKLCDTSVLAPTLRAFATPSW